MEFENVTHVSYCIGCACHDLKACDCGCSWLRVDRLAARGVCSQCPDHVSRWDKGDRSLAVPIDDNIDTIRKIVERAWELSDKGPGAQSYIAGTLDMLQWLGELTELERESLFASIGLPAPQLAAWVTEL